MKYFIDTAKVEDIKAAYDMGIICGVTTNPSLIGPSTISVISLITSLKSLPSFAHHDIKGNNKEN